MTPSIWTGMYAEVPLDEALRLLHEIGWRAFELSTEHLEAIENDPDPDGRIAEARDILAEHDLLAPQAHAYLSADVAAADHTRREADIERLARHTELAAALGVSTVVMHPGGRGDTAERQRDRELNTQAFRRLGDIAGEHDMMIGIENLMRPGASRPEEMLDLLEAIDHPAMGINLDTSHANVAELDIATMIRTLGDRLIGTHISDNDGSGDQHLTPGGGTIDWPPVVEALRAIGYEGTFNLEIPGERHRNLDLRRLRTRFALEVTEWLLL
jgi:sugar phosphate isomerase/epimerase